MLPEKATFDLLAVAERGEVVNDYGSSLQRETRAGSNSLRGKVGDGPSIRLTANRGSVSVRREGVAPSEIPEPPKPATRPASAEGAGSQDVAGYAGTRVVG